MKKLIITTILTMLALSLNACVPDISGDTNNYTTEVYGTYVGDGAYYIEQNGNGDILSCLVSDSNITCSNEELKEIEEILE